MRVFWLACLLAVAVADPQNCTTPFAMECTLPMGTFMSVGGSNLLRVAQNSYVYFVFAVSARRFKSVAHLRLCGSR
jgi:hypothetical protein